MSSIEQKILLSEENSMMVLVDQMGPARSNMAVVEPVMVPTLPAPPDTRDGNLDEPEDMEVDTEITNNHMNDLNQPMTDVAMSVEEQELRFTAEHDTGQIEEKILFNN